MDDYQFGHVYDKMIDEKDFDKFATLFGEGSPALTELIKFCFEHNIQTIASCKGHPEDRNIVEAALETGYISFRITDDLDLAYLLSSLPHKIKGVEARLEFLIEQGKSLTIEVPAKKKNMSEIYFKEILDILKLYILNKEANKEIEIDKETKKIVDYIFSYPSLDYFVIKSNKYQKLRREGAYLQKVAKCPRYKENMVLYRLLNLKLSEQNVDEFIKTTRR